MQPICRRVRHVYSLYYTIHHQTAQIVRVVRSVDRSTNSIEICFGIGKRIAYLLTFDSASGFSRVVSTDHAQKSLQQRQYTPTPRKIVFCRWVRWVSVSYRPRPRYAFCRCCAFLCVLLAFRVLVGTCVPPQPKYANFGAFVAFVRCVGYRGGSNHRPTNQRHANSRFCAWRKPLQRCANGAQPTISARPTARDVATNIATPTTANAIAMRCVVCRMPLHAPHVARYGCKRCKVVKELLLRQFWRVVVGVAVTLRAWSKHTQNAVRCLSHRDRVTRYYSALLL